jgi:hypothetical protein
MILKLPKKSECKPIDALDIERKLKSIVAYQQSATTTYLFYEEIDEWLGPWGSNGYPLGYGKKYNIAFTTDSVLNSWDHPITSSWVRQVTVNLQHAIINFIISEIKTGNITKLDEKTFRSAAFNSHPKAYLDAGLRNVAREEIESIPRIIMIPYAEFNPTNPNFIGTIRQIMDVITHEGIISWVGDMGHGTVKWPIRTLEAKLGEFYNYLDWEIKKLYGYPAYFY